MAAVAVSRVLGAERELTFRFSTAGSFSVGTLFFFVGKTNAIKVVACVSAIEERDRSLLDGPQHVAQRWHRTIVQIGSTAPDSQSVERT